MYVYCVIFSILATKQKKTPCLVIFIDDRRAIVVGLLFKLCVFCKNVFMDFDCQSKNAMSFWLYVLQ